MRELEDRILREATVVGGEVLKVDRFLNHQMDPALFRAMALEWRRLFPGEVTKLLTIEASGIGLAVMAADVFGVNAVFAKKSRTRNITGSVYTATVESFTHGGVYTILVAKEFLTPQDKVLILDDFLANGSALRGLIQIVEQSGARLVGCGVAVEKAFQPGGAALRAQGVRVEALARVREMTADGAITFC